MSTDNEKSVDNTLCIIKDFEAVWRHVCPPKPYLPLSSNAIPCEFYSKGGGADGKQAMGESPSFCDMLYHHLDVDDLHIPKSLLTARQHPSGQHFD